MSVGLVALLDDVAALAKVAAWDKSVRSHADALAKARELDPTKPRWIYDEGLLRAQIAGQAAQAADLLKAYIDRTRGQDPDLEQTLLARIAELDATKADENSAKPHVLQ